MIYAILIAGSVIVLLAYILGKARGRNEANRSALGCGAWVEVHEPVRVRVGLGQPKKLVPVGVQGIVSGVDREGRVSVWIAEPWVDLVGLQEVFDIEAIGKLRVKPPSHVDAEIRAQTFQELRESKEKFAERLAEYLPPGFLEIQRKLNP